MKKYPKITCKGYRHCSGYLLLSNFSIFIFWSCFIVMSKHVAGGRLSMMFGCWKGKDAIPTKRTTRSLVIQANWSFGCRHAMHQASILGWNQCYKLVMLQTGLLDTWLSQLQKVIYCALPRTKTADTIPTPAGRCNFSCSVSFQSGNMMQYHHVLNLSNQWLFGVQKIAGDDVFPIIWRCGSPKIRWFFSLVSLSVSWAKDEILSPAAAGNLWWIITYIIETLQLVYFKWIPSLWPLTTFCPNSSEPWKSWSLHHRRKGNWSHELLLNLYSMGFSGPKLYPHKDLSALTLLCYWPGLESFCWSTVFVGWCFFLAGLKRRCLELLWIVGVGHHICVVH